MRTTVIPAQITTVEDKIAGSLNLTQLMLLMVPVFWTTIVYAVFTPAMHVTLYKIPLVLVVLAISLSLAIRINGVVVLNWLMVVISYRLRPKLYVLNKNDPYLRPILIPPAQKPDQAHAFSIQKTNTPVRRLNVKDLLLIDRFMKKKKLGVRYRTGAKGGLHVAFERA